MRYPRPKKNGDKLAVLVLVVFGLCLLAMPFLPAARVRLIGGSALTGPAPTKASKFPANANRPPPLAAWSCQRSRGHHPGPGPLSSFHFCLS